MDIRIMNISDIMSQETIFWKTNLAAVPPNKITAKLFESMDIFDDFRKKYVDFFLSDINKINLPVDWFIFGLERALLEYWEPIKRAADHYVHYPHLIELGTAQLESYKEKLAITRDVSAILYFDKVPRALRIPFGPIMYIGIPLADAFREEWGSIPHELGHHVFWNSQFEIEDAPVTSLPPMLPRIAPPKSQNQDSKILPFKPSGLGGGAMPQSVPYDEYTNVTENIFGSLIEKSINGDGWSPAQRQKIKDTLNQWTEEIFAEFIGVKIAGADFVEAGWRKAASYVRKPSDAFYNDGKHPMPFLLPFIRKCANGEYVNYHAYTSQFQNLIGNNRVLAEPELDLMEATKNLIGNLSSKAITLTPIVSSEIDPFEQLTELLTEIPGSNLFEKLIQPMILEGTLTWRCACGMDNDIDRDVCNGDINNKHTIPWYYKQLRTILP